MDWNDSNCDVPGKGKFSLRGYGRPGGRLSDLQVNLHREPEPADVDGNGTGSQIKEHGSFTIYLFILSFG